MGSKGYRSAAKLSWLRFLHSAAHRRAQWSCTRQRTPADASTSTDAVVAELPPTLHDLMLLARRCDPDGRYARAREVVAAGSWSTAANFLKLTHERRPRLFVDPLTRD